MQEIYSNKDTSFPSLKIYIQNPMTKVNAIVCKTQI